MPIAQGRGWGLFHRDSDDDDGGSDGLPEPQLPSPHSSDLEDEGDEPEVGQFALCVAPSLDALIVRFVY